MSEIRLVLDDAEQEKVEILKKKFKISKGTELIRYLLSKAYSETNTGASQ